MTRGRPRKKIYENGFKNIVDNVIENSILEKKAPLQNIKSADYNLRQDLYTFNFNNLTYRYATDGIFKTLIEQPVLDAFKKFEIITDELDEEEKKKVMNDFYKKDYDLKIKNVMFWDRLYGGACLYYDNNDYIVFNKWDLSNVEKSNNILDDKVSSEKDLYFNGIKLEKDNCFILTGIEAPFYLKKFLNGWGLSIVEPLVAPSNLYEKTLNLIYELLDEAKIDVYKVDGLKDSVLAGQDKAVIDKIQLTNILKNYINAIVLDGVDNYEQKQLTNISSITQVLQEIKLDICASMKIPAVILWGMSPSGFSSGEFDLKQYQDKIQQEIQPRLKKVILYVLTRQIKELYNLDIENIDINFQNYIIQTKEQEENTKDKIFNRAKMLFDSKLLTKKELFEILKNENIININTKAEESEEYTEDIGEVDELKMEE